MKVMSFIRPEHYLREGEASRGREGSGVGYPGIIGVPGAHRRRSRPTGGREQAEPYRVCAGPRRVRPFFA